MREIAIPERIYNFFQRKPLLLLLFFQKCLLTLNFFYYKKIENKLQKIGKKNLELQGWPATHCRT
jgi:hypothetical protein